MKWSKIVTSALSAAALGFLALGLASTPAVAVTATANLGVSAEIVATCTISTTPVAFSNYTGVQVTSTVGGVSATCTNTTPYSIGLGTGTGTSATVTSRAMTGPGSAQLHYGLYTENTYTANWNDIGGTGIPGATGNGSAQSLTVYGNIPAGQYLAPGSYADTVIATVSY
jgi:spore coat protein U-like protein